MAWEKKNDIYVNDDIGCFLRPIGPTKIADDSDRIVRQILKTKRDEYKEKQPLLLPLGRGGAAILPYVSGELRKSLIKTEKDGNIDYVNIKVSRYKKGRLNKEGAAFVDKDDIRQALKALKNYDDAILLDDVFDKGHTATMVEQPLLESGKNILIATLYRKPYARATERDVDFYVRNYHQKTIDKKLYSVWLVFPWETDDHTRRRWKDLFPNH